MLLHVALYFGALSGLTTLAAFVPRMISARLWFGFPAGAVVVAATTLAAELLGGIRALEYGLGVVALLAAFAT